MDVIPLSPPGTSPAERELDKKRGEEIAMRRYALFQEEERKRLWHEENLRNKSEARAAAAERRRVREEQRTQEEKRKQENIRRQAAQIREKRLRIAEDAIRDLRTGLTEWPHDEPLDRLFDLEIDAQKFFIELNRLAEERERTELEEVRAAVKAHVAPASTTALPSGAFSSPAELDRVLDEEVFGRDGQPGLLTHTPSQPQSSAVPLPPQGEPG